MDLEALERRLRARRSVREILSSMRSLAASQLRQGLHALDAQRSYERTLRRGLARLPPHAVPVLAPTRILWVVWGTDQGLCGAYPRRLVEHARGVVHGAGALSGPVLAVGLRTAEQLERAGVHVGAAHSATGSLRGLDDTVQTVAEEAQGMLEARRCDGVSVIHVRHTGGPFGEPAVTRVYPMHPETLQRSHEPRSRIPVRSYEAPAVLWSRLLLEWSYAAFYRAALESFAAEQEARLRVTDVGTRNLDRALEELRVERDHLRKEAITDELMELVAGAASARERT